MNSGSGKQGSPPTKQPQVPEAGQKSATANKQPAGATGTEMAFKFTSGAGKIGKAYTLEDEELGSGSFAVVKKARRKADGSTYAVKIIDKGKVESMIDLEREVEIMSTSNHPHIVRLYEVFDEPKQMHLILELLEGGELFDRIVEKGSHTEKDAVRMLSQLCDALAYIHARNIVHRDLKPENLLLASSADDAPIKITDFGLARTMSAEEMMKTACGTPGYVAPEVLKNLGYSSGAVDMWSAGVILYVLLCGFPPFYEEELPELFNQIMTARYDFPSPHWDLVSAEAKACVTAMLTLDPEKRLRADQFGEQAWVRNAKGATSKAYTAQLNMVSGSLEKYQSMRSVKSINA